MIFGALVLFSLLLRFSYRRPDKKEFDTLDYFFLASSLVGMFWIVLKKKNSFCTAEAMGNELCLPRRRSPKTFEEDLDQLTRGYQNLQKHTVEELVRKMPEYTTEKGIHPDDDLVNLHIDIVKTAPQGNELLDHSEEFAVGVLKQVVYTVPGMYAPYLKGAGAASLIKGGVTSNVSCNLLDKSLEKGEEGIHKVFARKRKKSEEVKKNDE